jgi:hypothetical protein
MTDTKAPAGRPLQKKFLLLACLLSCGLFIYAASGDDWRTADRSSAGLAPDAAEHTDAVIQVYAARTFGWRGALAVHTWMATKPANAGSYTVHHVMGWRARRNLPVVVSDPDIPDRAWYGSVPMLLVDIRGDEADRLIPSVIDAVQTYPYNRKYVLWPGPNSNTFTAWVGRQVPELQLDLPSTAIGKDFLGATVVDNTPGGSGYQLSLYGLLGVSLGTHEGLELNLLGLNFGINPVKLQMKLPGVGVVGRQETVQPD